MFGGLLVGGFILYMVCCFNGVILLHVCVLVWKLCPWSCLIGSFIGDCCCRMCCRFAILFLLFFFVLLALLDVHVSFGASWGE